MKTNRIEAFSDGVLAIIITIMVLGLQIPREGTFTALLPLIPVFLSYVLSFVYVGIYWNNHHHMLHVTSKVSGAILWSNLHLLFWLSLIPFSTGWMGQNHFEKAPTAFYGVILLMCALAYLILQLAIIRHQGSDSILKKAVGRDIKGKFSLAAYTIAVALAWIAPAISQALYVIVAVVWLVPDKRIEGRFMA